MDELTKGWKEYLIASLGGGAVYEITDQLASRFLGLGTIAGLSLKDILLILLNKYLAEKTSGTWRSVFQGATVIGLYKVVYQQFVKPIVSGVVGGVTGAVQQAPTAPTNEALMAAQSYIASEQTYVI
jgi:hypothetical protein